MVLRDPGDSRTAGGSVVDRISDHKDLVSNVS